MDFFQAAKSARIQRPGLIPDDVNDFRICFIVDCCQMQVHEQTLGLYSSKALIVL